MMAVQLQGLQRRSHRIRGLVQGVGFRPFVFRLATKHGLAGFVRNETDGVLIEVEGDPRLLDAFEGDLGTSAPPAARVQAVSSRPEVAIGEARFRVEKSLDAPRSAPLVSTDLATCQACLHETLGASDRHRGYAFTACSECGPRFTMIERPPYDRERTSMAEFPMCRACRAEYENPDDRRYHAEGTACPDCGPRVRLLAADGREETAADPISEAARRLRLGAIVAVKGLGGFHLACLAGHEEAVATLRRRKGRDEKPFAVMAANSAEARRLCDVSTEEESLLGSPQRPIVLLRRRPGAPIAAGVAPGNPLLGVMLPYTPLHHLLLREAGGEALVLTSANSSDLPIAQDEEEALRSLAGIADAFLSHARAIRTRSDDSVARIVDGDVLLLRRSRGYAPAPLPLPRSLDRATLALGGALKATFALGRGREAILSHHLGDLGAYEAYRGYAGSIEHYQKLFQFTPDVLVHDLHPDYASTVYAVERAGREGLQRVAVQHHHAHLASCMAENGLEGPVIGVTFDGTGYGTDGAVWGGEFLVGDCRAVRRAGHLEYVPMPGGEAAIREPWRMAAAYLAHSGESVESLRARVPERALEVVGRLLRRDLNSPRTSSCGRLFDGVASLLGVRDRVSYEGQAAIELEWLARGSAARGAYPVELAPSGDIRLAPVIQAILGDLRRNESRADIARRFHRTVAEIIRRSCLRLREETGLGRVALSGGVFMNEILLTETRAVLEGEKFDVYRHREIPPNDGGICFGQLAVAAAGGGD